MADETQNDMKEEVAEVAPFDPTKKNKKKKITIIDPAAEKTENLTVSDRVETAFSGLKKKKKKPVEMSNLNDESGDAIEDVDGVI